MARYELSSRRMPGTIPTETRNYYERAGSAKRVLLRIRENPGTSGRGHAFERHTSGTESPIDKRSSLVGTPIPSTLYGTNAESFQYLLWLVVRAVSQNLSIWVGNDT